MNLRAAKRIAGLATLATLGVATFSVATVASAKSVTPTPAISETVIARSNGGERGRPDLSKVAALLGMTTDELKAELRSGKSLAAVAGSKNVAVSSIIGAIVAGIKTHLDAEVLAGKHTQAEASAKLAEATTRVTEMVNKVRPAGAHDRPHRGGHDSKSNA